MKVGARKGPRWGHVLLVLAVALGGCALYHPHPLPEQPDLRPELPKQQAPPSQPLPGIPGAKQIQSGKPLDMTQVAVLAVLDSPSLRALRAESGVARAELLNAGLLPDPTVGLSGAKTLTSGFGLANPYMISLSEDLSALITRGARVDAKRAAAHQTQLHILWEEWQTAQEARTLYVELVTDRERLQLLRRVRDLYENRYQHSFRAYQHHNLTLETTGADLAAFLTANGRVNQMERSVNRARHRLNALLGLAPELPVALDPLESPAMFPQANVEKALKTLPKRRPDLLALQAGYRSQEADVRRAILEQFPAVSLSPEYSRDNSKIAEIGLSIDVTLPLLNRNRGRIAIARATRAKLAEEYQARLDDAQSQVAVLASQQELLAHQAERLEKNLPELADMTALAEKAYRAGNMDALSYLNLENTLLDKRLELVDLEQARWDTRIALDTLLANTASPPPSAGPSRPAGRPTP